MNKKRLIVISCIIFVLLITGLFLTNRPNTVEPEKIEQTEVEETPETEVIIDIVKDGEEEPIIDEEGHIDVSRQVTFNNFNVVFLDKDNKEEPLIFFKEDNSEYVETETEFTTTIEGINIVSRKYSTDEFLQSIGMSVEDYYNSIFDKMDQEYYFNEELYKVDKTNAHYEYTEDSMVGAVKYYKKGQSKPCLFIKTIGTLNNISTVVEREVYIDYNVEDVEKLENIVEELKEAVLIPNL